MNLFRRFNYYLMMKWMKNIMKRAQCCFYGSLNAWKVYLNNYLYSTIYKNFFIFSFMTFQSQARPWDVWWEGVTAGADKQWFQCGYLVSDSPPPPLCYTSYTNHTLDTQYHHLISSESNEYSIDLKTWVQTLFWKL